MVLGLQDRRLQTAMYASLSSALLGASILSLSTSAYLVLSGRITGLSGIFGGLLELKKDEFTWKATYAVGMSLTLLTLYELAPSLMISKSHNGQVISWLGAALGGIILGVGTTYVNFFHHPELDCPCRRKTEELTMLLPFFKFLG